jgi:hypothetical protein
LQQDEVMQQQDEAMEPEWVIASNASRTRYFEKVINGRARAAEQHSKIPLKIASIESYPRCIHCKCRFSSQASLEDHLFQGCNTEPQPKKHIILLNKQAKKPNIIERKRAETAHNDSENRGK